MKPGKGIPRYVERQKRKGGLGARNAVHAMRTRVRRLFRRMDAEEGGI